MSYFENAKHCLSGGLYDATKGMGYNGKRKIPEAGRGNKHLTKLLRKGKTKGEL